MMKLYAQPYDISATGFYFSSLSEFTMSSIKCKNANNDPIEEYEIQFIDGDLIDAELVKAWGLTQANFTAFLEKVETWYDWEKIAYIIAVAECGCDHEELVDDPSCYDIIIYEADTMSELAEQFVAEGLIGEFSEHIERYIDYDAIARDLEVDYSQVTIAGTSYIYTCR